jgi:hypothetical protein
MNEDTITEPLRAFLTAFGLFPASDTRENPKAVPEPNLKAWRPSYPNEEPPF